MARTTSSMVLKVWNNLADKFNHTDLAGNWDAIDAHDHTSGKGVPLGTASLQNGSVTHVKLDTNSVDSTNISVNAVGSSQLAANSVTTGKITDANVTTAKIADASITTAKITDANVTYAKLAADTKPPSWTNLTANLAISLTGSHLAIRLEPGGLVRLKGTITNSGSPKVLNTNLLNAVLASTYRPANDVAFPASSAVSGNDLAILFIGADGSVTLNDSFATNGTVCFSGLTYTLDD